MKQRAGAFGFARRHQGARVTAAAEPEHRPEDVTPAPSLTTRQLAGQLADDPEFREFVRGELAARANKPW